MCMAARVVGTITIAIAALAPTYVYTDLSDELKDNLDLLPLGGRRLRIEHSSKRSKNLHLTPWLQLTGDLQILRPNRPAADTAVVPAVRLKGVSRRS